MSQALSVNARLEPLIALSDALQAAINAGHWRRATEIDVQRRQALEALIAELSAAGTTELTQRLEQLQQHTQHLLGQAHHHKRRLLREASTLKTGRVAAREYESAATID